MQKLFIPKLLLFKLLLLTSLLLLASCSIISSNQETTPLNAQPKEFTSLELYMTRSSLGKTEFEQIKIHENGELFVECGRIKGGRHQAEIQEIGKISSSDISNVKITLGNFGGNLSKHSLDKPGDNDNFFDPGKFTIRLQTPSGKETLKTSLDAIADGASKKEASLRKTASLLRRAGEDALDGELLCRNSNFYGIK